MRKFLTFFKKFLSLYFFLGGGEGSIWKTFKIVYAASLAIVIFKLTIASLCTFMPLQVLRLISFVLYIISFLLFSSRHFYIYSILVSWHFFFIIFTVVLFGSSHYYFLLGTPFFIFYLFYFLHLYKIFHSYFGR